MIQSLRKHARLIVVVGTMTALVAGPVLAGNIVPNADKVDGFHAVGSGTSRAKRAKSLVATNKQGRLPNNIIQKAPDANKLDGIDSSELASKASVNTLEGDLAGKQDELRRVVVVDTKTDGNGDVDPVASGTALVQAFNVLPAATAADPVVVKLAPGTYDLGSQGVVLPNHSSLVGAGRTRTIVKSVGMTPVWPGTNSTVSDLRIERTDNVGVVTGIDTYYGGDDIVIEDVDVVVEGGTSQTEAILVYGSEVTLKDVDAKAYANGGTSYGMRLTAGGDADIYDSKLLGRFGDYANGIYSGTNSFIRVFRSDIEGRSAPASYGIYAEASSGEIWDSQVRVEAASSSAIALEVTQPPSGTRRFTVQNSILEAWRNIDDATSSWAVVGRASTVINIANTQLQGGNPTSVGTLKCAGVHDENFNFSASTCFP